MIDAKRCSLSRSQLRYRFVMNNIRVRTFRQLLHIFLTQCLSLRDVWTARRFRLAHA